MVKYCAQKFPEIVLHYAGLILNDLLPYLPRVEWLDQLATRWSNAEAYNSSLQIFIFLLNTKNILYLLTYFLAQFGISHLTGAKINLKLKISFWRFLGDFEIVFRVPKNMKTLNIYTIHKIKKIFLTWIFLTFLKRFFVKFSKRWIFSNHKILLKWYFLTIGIKKSVHHFVWKII